MTNKLLQEHYQRFNRQYFGNKLPPCQVVWADLSRHKAVGRHHVKVWERKSPDTGHWRMCRIDHNIDICPRIKKFGSYWRTTLLHEMAHIAVDLRGKKVLPHGKIWQQEMLRLATAGAFKNLW